MLYLQRDPTAALGGSPDIAVHSHHNVAYYSGDEKRRLAGECYAGHITACDGFDHFVSALAEAGIPFAVLPPEPPLRRREKHPIEALRQRIVSALSFLAGATLATVSERGDAFSLVCGDYEIDVHLAPLQRDKRGDPLMPSYASTTCKHAMPSIPVCSACYHADIYAACQRAGIPESLCDSIANAALQTALDAGLLTPTQAT